MLISIVLLSLTSASYAEVNFDQGVNTNKVVVDSTYAPLPGVKYGVPQSIRTTRDCARFNFGPSDNEIMSDKVWLRSDEYRTECYTTYVPGPNGQQIPQQHCYERLYQTYRSQAQINIKQRKLWPWEKETFEVCLEGKYIEVYMLNSVYNYKIKNNLSYKEILELHPNNRKIFDKNASAIVGLCKYFYRVIRDGIIYDCVKCLAGEVWEEYCESTYTPDGLTSQEMEVLHGIQRAYSK